MMFSFFGRQQPKETNFHFSQRELSALLGTAVSLAGKLERLLRESRAAVRQREPQEADIFSLIDKLKEFAAQGVQEMHELESSSTQQGEAVFDQMGHSLYVAPSANLLQAPEAAVNAAMSAVNRGVTNASFVHCLMLAELDVVLQRWRIALAAGIANGN